MGKNADGGFGSWLRSQWERYFPPAEFPTLGGDGIPWKIFPAPNRVVAVGDLHGDLDALATILEARGLIDGDGKWNGGHAHLVLLGDLVGGHKHSRFLVEFVLELEDAARRARGQVHALIGNHDLLPCRGVIRKMSDPEREKYRRYPVAGCHDSKAREAFRGASQFARWVAQRNAIVQIGDSLFAHAGLDRWALDAEPGRVNATVRAWIRHWQGAGDKPPSQTRWAVGVAEEGETDMSPLWTRAFKVRSNDEGRPEGGPSRKTISAILEKYSARRIVIGHAPVPGREILLEHPWYGESVVLADTHLSDPKRGRLSAVEIVDGRISVAYPKRNDEVHPVVRRIKARLKEDRSPRGWWERIFGRR